MLVTLQFPSERPLDLVGFGWSPLFEAALSLPVVVHPKRTPMHLPWARRCRDLPGTLRDEIAVLAGHFQGFVPGIFEVGLGGSSPAFEDDLEAFCALGDDLVAYELSLALGGIGCASMDDHGPHLVRDPAYRAQVLAAAEGDPATTTLARATFDDPGSVRDRYARMLEQYWELAFRDEWDRVLPRIEAEVTAGAHALVTRGLPGLVGALLPEGRWDESARAIVIDKTWERTFDVADRGRLLFVPTLYGWPCVLIELADPWPASVIFPLRDLRRPEVPQASDGEVASGFRALGDETRIQIARLVAEDARSTRELAELLSLSDSAISRHLKILEAAGLVTSRRDGYFVLYQLCPDRIDVLGGALRSTLGLAPGSGAAVPPLSVSVARTTG